MSEELIEHGQLLRIQPGDRLIIKFDRYLTDADVAEARRRIDPRLGDIPYLVIGRGIDVSVLRQESE
jgi:hypothetical protein